MELVIVTFIAYIAAVGGQSFQYLITSPPEPTVSEDIYMYAIDPEGSADKCQIDLPGNLPGCPQVVESGNIASGGTSWGRYVRLGPLQRRAGLRYGGYNATFSNLPTDCIPKSIVRRSFVRRKSGILDTGGTWTVTVYRNPQYLSQIVPTTIGVTKGRESNVKYHWLKEGERVYGSCGPRYPITSPSDAGIYTLKRRGRGGRGWFVEIIVTIASCPEGMALSSSGECRPSTCPNGGVPSDEFSHCICSNLFDPRTICLMPYPSADNDRFVIGYSRTTNACLTCKDLPGGHPTCKRMLFCHGDLYGCKCGSGWRGGNCDKPCKMGTWGPSCTETCPPHDSCCDRFFGPDTEDLCAL